MEIKRKLTLNRVKRRKKARVLAGDYAVLGSLIAIVCIWCACVVKYERDLEKAMGIGIEPRYISIRSDTTTEIEAQVQQSEQITEEFVVYDIPEEYKLTGGTLPADFQKHLQKVCSTYGVEYAVALAMIETESSYRPDAKGKAGDYGYFQIVEKYHKDRMKELKVSSVDDPKDNATVAIDCLAQYIERFGSVDKALTAYNHGVTGAYRDVWTDTGEEQSEYSKKVLKKAARIRKELAAVGNAEE